MAKKRSAWATVDVERLLSEIQSPDETVRGDAVRSLCPCHTGREVFEQHVSLVHRLMRDSSRVVRAHALHVFEDAARMQLADDLNYFRQSGEGSGHRNHAARFRPEETDSRAGHKGRRRRRRRRRPGSREEAT